MARRNRRAVDIPRTCVIGGRAVVTLTYHCSGPHWEPRPGLARLTPAGRMEAADWLARAWVPRLEHEAAYQLLFPGQ